MDGRVCSVKFMGREREIHNCNQSERKAIITAFYVSCENCITNMRPLHYFHNCCGRRATEKEIQKESENTRISCVEFTYPMCNRKQQQFILRVHQIGIESTRRLNMLTLCVGNKSNNVFIYIDFFFRSRILCVMYLVVVCVYFSLSGSLHYSYALFAQRHKTVRNLFDGFSTKFTAQFTDFHMKFYHYLQIFAVNFRVKAIPLN